MLGLERTIVSQYANSPTLRALIENFNEYIDPRASFDAFYELIWNVDTAVGEGLNIWGRIVGVGRELQISAANETFGYINEDFPYDWAPFGQGTFSTGTQLTTTYTLSDDAYRVLILTKALSNIVATNAPSLNALLQNLFPGRGRCYVLDLGAMRMRFVFEFSLTNIEYAILTQSGALPHPAGVRYSVIVVPTAGLFGFRENGPLVQPFDFGVMYNPPV